MTGKTNTQIPSVKRSRLPGVVLTLLSLLVWSGLMVAASVPLTHPLVVFFAALGSCLGVIIGWFLAASKIRTYICILVGLFLLFVTMLISAWIKESLSLGNELGSYDLYWLSDLIFWFCIPLFSISILRLLSIRRHSLMLLELVLAASFLTALIAGHRDGNLNRPWELIDWALLNGISPLTVLLALGGIFGLGLVVLLASRRKIPHPFLNLSLILMIAVFLLVLLMQIGTPLRYIRSSLGLTGKGKEEKDKDKQDKGKGGRGGNKQEDKAGEKGGGKEKKDNQGGSQSKDGSNESTNTNELEMKNEYPQPQNTPVAVVVLHTSYTPPYKTYYFRQTAFSLWNGRKLVKATSEGLDNDIVPYFPTTEMTIPFDTLTTYAASFNKIESTVALISDHTQPFGLVTGLKYSGIENPNPQLFARAYKVTSWALAKPYDNLLGLRSGSGRWDKATREHYTKAPDDPRYKALADTLSMFIPKRWRDDPIALAVVFVNYLEEKGIYSRSSDHADAEDPTAHFLFGNKKGYCVHFAHAVVLLLRSKGIPSRVAAGYAVDSRQQERGSSILLMTSNAHAWPEIYLDGLGWLVFDVVPKRTEEKTMPPPDKDLQQMLGEMARGNQAEEKKARQELKQEERSIDYKQLLNAAMLLGLIASLMLLALLYSIKMYRKVIPSFASDGNRLRLTYRAVLDVLGEGGLRREYGETRIQFADRLMFNDLGSLSLALQENAIGKPLQPQSCSKEESKMLISSTYTFIKQHAPLWRIALGLLNPLSWWGSS